jgi:hypothetical protein
MLPCPNDSSLYRVSTPSSNKWPTVVLRRQFRPSRWPCWGLLSHTLPGCKKTCRRHAKARQTAGVLIWWVAPYFLKAVQDNAIISAPSPVGRARRSETSQRLSRSLYLGFSAHQNSNGRAPSAKTEIAPVAFRLLGPSFYYLPFRDRVSPLFGSSALPPIHSVLSVPRRDRLSCPGGICPHHQDGTRCAHQLPRQ